MTLTRMALRRMNRPYRLRRQRPTVRVARLNGPTDADARVGDRLKPVSIRRLALLLGGLAMFGPFSIDTIFPAFPQMGAQLGADKLAMQQTISVYLLAYALMSVVHGPLSDAIGRRKVILGGLVVFTLASVGCALSRDLARCWRSARCRACRRASA